MSYAEFLASKAALAPKYTPDVPGYTLAEFDELFPSDGAGHAYIYGLHDPGTGELRYIGKSIRPRQRLQNQLNEHPNTHRGHWLDQLNAAGLAPIQTIIDSATVDGDWQSVERIYIAAARAAGPRLTNATDGGDGVPNLTPEARAKLSARFKGKSLSADHRAALSAGQRRRPPASDVTRQRMREAMVGRTFTDEWRSKISHSLRRFTDDQIRQIRQDLGAGRTQYDVAAEYGVTQASIWRIARRRTYGDVQ